MAKILCMGDQHVRKTGSFLPFNQKGGTGLSYGLDNIIRGYRKAEQIMEEHDIAAFVNLGDVFHNYDVIPQEAVCAAGIGMNLVTDACRKRGVIHYVLNGNHDVSSMTPVISSLMAFQNDACEVFTAEDSISIGDLRIGMIPFLENDDLHLAWQKHSEDDLIFTHNEIKGAMYESGKVTDHQIDNPSKPVIVAGHIHLAQRFKNVHLPGSLVQDRFNRPAIDTFGFCVIDTETLVVDMIMNDMSRHYVLCQSVSEAHKFNPNRVVIKLYSDEDRDEAERKLKGYTFMHMKPPKKRDQASEVSYNQQVIHEPDTLLRTFVNEARPTAFNILTEVLGGTE